MRDDRPGCFLADLIEKENIQEVSFWLLPFLEDGCFREDPEKKRIMIIFITVLSFVLPNLCVGVCACIFLCFREKRREKKQLWASHGECMWLDRCLSFGINETASPEEHGPCIGLTFYDILCFFMFLVFFVLMVLAFTLRISQGEGTVCKG